MELHLNKEKWSWGQSDNMEGRIFVLHAANYSLIFGITYSPLTSLPRIFFEFRVRSNHWELLGMAQKQRDGREKSALSPKLCGTRNPAQAIEKTSQQNSECHYCTQQIELFVLCLLTHNYIWRNKQEKQMTEEKVTGLTNTFWNLKFMVILFSRVSCKSNP